MPRLGLNLQPRYVSCPGIDPQPCTERCSNQQSFPARARHLLFPESLLHADCCSWLAEGGASEVGWWRSHDSSKWARVSHVSVSAVPELHHCSLRVGAGVPALRTGPSRFPAFTFALLLPRSVSSSQIVQALAFLPSVPPLMRPQ